MPLREKEKRGNHRLGYDWMVRDHVAGARREVAG
jgi:hypothetical protein